MLSPELQPPTAEGIAAWLAREPQASFLGLDPAGCVVPRPGAPLHRFAERPPPCRPAFPYPGGGGGVGIVALDGPVRGMGVRVFGKGVCVTKCPYGSPTRERFQTTQTSFSRPCLPIKTPSLAVRCSLKRTA